MTKLETALHLAARGFHVFPLRSDSKVPVFNGWPDEASRDVAKITAWWSGSAQAADRNIGLYCGKFGDGSQSLLALDVDRKNGKDGCAELLKHEMAGRGLPATYTQQTTTGGLHYVFLNDTSIKIKNSAGDLGPGLDVRGIGGFIVAKGSTLNGKPYTADTSQLPVPAPAWLVEKCGAPRERTANAQTPLVPLDAPAAIARAAEYLKGEEPALQGSGGDAHTYKVCCRVRDYAVSEDACFDLMLGEFNDRCQPPWNSDDLREKVRNAYKFGQMPPGSKAAEAEFKAIPAAVLPPPRPDALRSSVFDGATLSLECADDITPEQIRWLWPGWLARGKLHLLAGAPGTGKTTIALALASVLTQGGKWPDGSATVTGSVLMWSGEDSPGDTLVPRLIAHGADLKRVRFVGDVMEAGRKRAFDPSSDIGLFREAAQRLGDVRLILVDPIVNAVSGDSHKNNEVRRGLQPLIDLAEELDAALLGIAHFSKGTAGRDPLERTNGSVAFGAVPRISMAAAKVNDGEKERRIFVRTKSNIGPDGGGFEYDIQQKPILGRPAFTASKIEWGKPLAGSARDLLATDTTADEGRHSKVGEAVDFLKGALAAGPVAYDELEADAKARGISVTGALQRAKQRLGIKPEKTAKGWAWKLPDASGKARETSWESK